MEKLCGSGETKLTGTIDGLSDITESLIHLNEKILTLKNAVKGETPTNASQSGTVAEGLCGMIEAVQMNKSNQNDQLETAHSVIDELLSYV